MPRPPRISGPPFFLQAEDGIRDWSVTGVQTCALPISWLPLVRQLRPRGERGVVMREGLVRAGRRDLGADRAVQRSDHAREVLRVEQRVAPGEIGRASYRERV